MKPKVLITGIGTVASSFIQQYEDYADYTTINRNELLSVAFSKQFPNVTSLLCDIRNLSDVIRVFQKVKPDIVIHTAAMKHINLAEENPLEAVDVNVVGSKNIIDASIRTDVPLTIGVSTDKACNPDSVYGYSKKLMEQMFLDAHSSRNKFVCTRFANVAGASGSVIPFWKKLKRENKPLLITDIGMNRMMFSMTDSAKLIKKAIDISRETSSSFILSKSFKAVNMLDLAMSISNEYSIVGIRPGEKLNETLISKSELNDAYYIDDYIILHNDELSDKRVTTEIASDTVDKMSASEIEELLK